MSVECSTINETSVSPSLPKAHGPSRMRGEKTEGAKDGESREDGALNHYIVFICCDSNRQVAQLASTSPCRYSNQ